ncbi:MAG TPA: hypothetical protein VGQ86_02610 [Candidatus Limnocylindria bacterium]|nr:hypothetical protein [Candidatus Limnocylindria bacterium]
MSWRTVALAVCWLAAAGFGVLYLIAPPASSPAYVAVAVGHFIIGYLWARAIMSRPMTMATALLGTFAAGAFTRVALVFGTEFIFFWVGPLAAIALSDLRTPRNIAYSTAAFVLGVLALFWLAPPG